MLLKRFASRHSGRKHWIWQLGRTGEPIEVSTRDVAVAGRFYEDAESEVERALMRFESRVSHALERARPGVPSDADARELRWLVYILAVRTRSLRSHVADATDRIMAGLSASATPERVQRALRKEVEGSIDELIEGAISELPIHQRQPARLLMSLPGLREWMKTEMLNDSSAVKAAAFFRAVLAGIRSGNRVEVAMKTGHLRGIDKLLSSEDLPKSFEPRHWFIAEVGSGDLILGDSCVVATSGAEAGLLLRFGPHWSHLLLPLSPSLLLVAANHDAPEVPDATAANRVSAGVSHDFVYGASNTPGFRALAPLIGSADAVLTEEELARFPDDAWEGVS